MSGPSLTTRIEHGVMVLTLQGVTTQNPMSAALNLAVQQACRAAQADPAVEALVISGGEGASFCAGGDFNEVSVMTDPDEIDAWIDRTIALYVAVLNLDKPTVAAVDGFAIGTGFQLALSCDLRIATPQAKFLMWELKHGLACTIGAYMLEQFLGRAVMLDLLLDCEPMSTEQALTTRLVHSVVPPRVLEAEAIALARRLADYPALPRRRTKQFANGRFIQGLYGISPETKAAHRESFAAAAARAHFERVLGRGEQP